MKVSILLPDLRGGGTEKVNIALGVAFRSLGLDVEFVLMNATGELLSDVKGSFSIIDLNAKKIREVPVKLAIYLRKHRPNALIANMWPLTSAACIARFLSGTKLRLLLVEHGMLTEQYASWGLIHKVLMRLSIFITYRTADSIAAVSKGAARSVAMLSYLPEENVEVLYNPVPYFTPSVSMIERANLLWGCSRYHRILAVGNIKDQKNYSFLLRVFASSILATAKLMIVGGGDESPLRRLAKDLGVVERVIFAGFHKDPSAFYATADVFVLTSTDEGFGNVLVEALSFGLPVVSTDCPAGPSEILEGGNWGRLIPVGDSISFLLAIKSALSESTDRVLLKQRAADFEPIKVARQYLAILKPQ